MKDQLALRTNTGGRYQICNATSNSLMYLQEDQPMGQMRGYIVLGTWGESEREFIAFIPDPWIPG